MTRTMTSKSLAAASILLLLTAAAPAFSDDHEFTWSLEELEIGVLEKDVDTDSAKFEEYRDFKSGIRPSFKLFGESADGNRTLALNADGIGRNDARYTLDYGLAGEYALEIDYNKIQHLFGNNATFIWDIPRIGVYEIPDIVQQQFEQAIRDRAAISPFAVNAGFLGGLIQPLFDTADRIDLGLQRDRTRLRFDLGKLGRTSWGFEYRNENRRGGRPYSGSFGFFNVIEIFEPIAYQTTDAEISGEWNGDSGGLQFGYRNSTFENDVSTLIWDNPWFGADSTDGRAYLSPSGLSQNGPRLGFADLAPDNDASTLYLSGRGRFGGSWWANGNLSMIEMTQDEPFLPYTLNTAIVGVAFPSGATFDPTTTATLPAARGDNKVDVMNLTGSLGTDFNDDWSLTFRYRYYDYDVGSRQFDFDGYVRFHAVWEEVPRTNVPYDYTRDNMAVELGWQASPKTNLSLTYGMESWDRSFRETQTTDEDSIKLTIDTRATDKVSVSASWETGDRTNDGYETAAQNDTFLDPHGINNQPGLRKYPQAARDFDDYQAQVRIFGSSAWNFSFGLSGREEDYTESLFGLVSDEIMSANFEVAYNPGANLNCYFFGHLADRESFQRARQSGGTLSTDPLDDWELLLVEDNTTFGFGVTSDAKGPWSLDLNGYYSESDGEADFTTPPGGRDAVDFDNYEDIELLGLDLRVDYNLNEVTALGFRYLYEDYTINSFNLQGLTNFLPSTLLLVPSFGDYEANIFGVYLKLQI